MRMPNSLSELEMREINLRDAKQSAYERECPMMSRADRRTNQARNEICST
jgi:hypothetical protein